MERLPFLYIGAMREVLLQSGTMLVDKEFDQIRWMGSAIKFLQFLSKDTGISSGPAAAEGFMSSIASIISSFENSIISST